MPKVKNPITFSGYFGVDPKKLDQLGVLDPTLAIDTKLFIDPLLFSKSTHPEIRNSGVKEYRRHFENVIKLLVASNHLEDAAWRNARRLLKFHEIRGTCLGYGAVSIHGSGFGLELTERILYTGKEIVDLGIRDPDLFSAMALFEADIGPDRISDMATNVVLPALIAFNCRILIGLGLEGEEFDIFGTSGKFLSNPFQLRRTPIILVPKDILRDLPIAQNWDDVAYAASKNQSIRNRVNKHIGHIWAAKTKRDKKRLRSQALTSKEAFQTLLDSLHRVPPTPYNVDLDPAGLIKWASIAEQYASKFPLNLNVFQKVTNLDALHRLVAKITEQFQQLIENNALNKELYNNGQPRHEKTAQKLFFAVAHSYCKANNVDISPEVDSGTGQVDFKLSKGFDERVLVEIKLSTNSKLVQGYRVQLETYKKAEETMRAIYVVIDVGKMGNKDKRLIKIKNEAAMLGNPLSDLIFIDGAIKASASKR